MESKGPSRLRYLLLLLVGAAIVVAILTASCHEILGAVNDEIISKLENETIVTNSDPVVTPTRLTDLQELCTAAVTSDVFLRREVPARALGMKIYSTDAWQLVVGTVTAAVDLSQVSAEDMAIDENGVYQVSLPAPTISGCHIDYEASQSGNSLQGSPFESAEEVASAQDAMMEEARDSLRVFALNAGILEQARENSAAAVADLIHSLTGESTEIRVRFHDMWDASEPGFTECGMGEVATNG